MPIDFEAVVAPFRDPVHQESKALILLFTRIGLRIDKLAKQAAQLEVSTRDLPVFEFVGDALGVRVVVPPGERITLGPEGFVEGLKTGGQDFVDGFKYVGVAVEAERALMSLVRVPAVALGEVVASLERFQGTPEKEWFDPTRRTFMDIFGLAGLAFRALSENPDQLEKLLVGTARTVKTNVDSLLGEGGGASTSGGGPPSGIDALPVLIGQVALLLPVLPEVLTVALADVILPIEHMLLDTFREVADAAFELRMTVLNEFVTSMDLLAFASVYLDALQLLVESIVEPLASFIPYVVYGLTEGLGAVWDAIKAWADWIVKLVDGYRRLSEAIWNIDLVPILIGPLLGAATSALGVKFTVGQLLEGGTEAGAEVTRRALHLALDAYWATQDAKNYLSQQPMLPTTPEREGWHELIDAFLIRRDPRLGAVSPFTATVGFPDVSAMFDAGKAESIVKAVGDLGDSVAVNVKGALDGAAAGVQATGETFRKEADRLALGGGAVAMALGPAPADLARMAFGQERPEAGKDPLALAWDELVARGGFALVAAVLPTYLEALRDHWRSRRPPPDADTSPHILLKRARAHGMHLTEIEVFADVTQLDDAAAETVAAAIAAGLSDKATTTLYAAELAGTGAR